MSAFYSLIFLIFIAALSMATVAYMNFKEENDVKRREKLRLLKIRLEDLEDMVMLLDSMCDNRTIPRLVNDDVVDLYHDMIELAPNAAYLKAGKTIAETRAQELSDEAADRVVSRLCHSDSQMAKMKHYCQQAMKLLNQQYGKGRISMTELQALTEELQWVNLQIDVISYIAQGHKAYNKNDVLSANAFYKKAQTALLRSNHPDVRRQQMISQVADILFGRRKSLDEDLMPEIEFNPDLESNIHSSNTNGDASVVGDLENTNENGDIHPELLQSFTQAKQNESSPAASH